MRAKPCINCHQPVGEGDRHARFSCPPKAKGALSNRRKQRARKKKAAKRDELIPQRGQAIAGTGVPKGASKG